MNKYLDELIKTTKQKNPNLTEQQVKSLAYQQDCLTLGGTLILNNYPVLENELDDYADKHGV